MFTVTNYALAVVFCIVTMICWGSWGNTQKLVSKNWRYELFYWDYVIGMVLFTVILGLTMGSHGAEGRPFWWLAHFSRFCHLQIIDIQQYYKTMYRDTNP